MRSELRRRAGAPRDVTEPEDEREIERRSGGAVVPDIDEPDEQDRIMRPQWVEMLLTTEGDAKVRLPAEFSIGDLRHRRVMEQLEQYARMLNLAMRELRADASLQPAYVTANPGVVEAGMLDPDLRTQIKRIIASVARPIETRCASRSEAHSYPFAFVADQTTCPECGESLIEGSVTIADLEPMDARAFAFAGLYFLHLYGRASVERKKKAAPNR